MRLIVVLLMAIAFAASGEARAASSADIALSAARKKPARAKPAPAPPAVGKPRYRYYRAAPPRRGGDLRHSTPGGSPVPRSRGTP